MRATWMSGSTIQVSINRRAGRGRAAVVAALGLALAACGGGDGGTAPVTVALVAITSPAAPPAFGALGRTTQCSAEARDASGAPIAGATITWVSSNAGVVTASPSGLVTAVGIGSAQVRAVSGGVQSAPLNVTVSQVPAQLAITPSTLVFGAIGSSRQLAGAVTDSTGNAIAGQGVVWSHAGSGATASVSATGLVTALAVGASDTAVATAGALVGRAPISVTQVVASVTVTSTSSEPDTLRTTGRTRQFSAVARDSLGNALGGAAITWSSNAPAIAAVSPSGLVTAVGDGAATVTATAAAISGNRAIVVQRYAATFALAPGSATISTSGGSASFTGSALDSAATTLSIAWVSRGTSVFTVSPATGAATTATATGNGSSYLVMSAGTRADSALVTVSGQSTAVSFAASVQPIFTARCAGCHTGVGSTLPGAMNLSAGSAWAQIVNVGSMESPGLMRVKPGDVTNSYLARKIDPTVGAISGAQMPDGGTLTAQQIQTIKTWIQQGALNN